MAAPRLSNLEFRIMEILWDRGEVSIREACEAMEQAGGTKRPAAYTTVQTTVYRMETKGIVRRVRKSGNLHLFKAAITRDAAQRTLIDELLGFFGGSGMPVMAHLIQRGKLSLEDIKDAEAAIEKLKKARKK